MVAKRVIYLDSISPVVGSFLRATPDGSNRPTVDASERRSMPILAKLGLHESLNHLLASDRYFHDNTSFTSRSAYELPIPAGFARS